MSDVRLVEASLEITFDKADVNPDEFEKEFIKISDADDDSIGQWLRVAKARGDVAESDPAMLYLMVELYRKMDRLEQLMTQSAPKQL
ncbi:MAG TPA: hypothetical protein VFX57_05120, partial [Sulfuricurvum sp.]|nr:hypothetical protein [Sulfuricurvum sp.]